MPEIQVYAYTLSIMPGNRQKKNNDAYRLTQKSRMTIKPINAKSERSLNTTFQRDIQGSRMTHCRETTGRICCDDTQVRTGPPLGKITLTTIKHYSFAALRCAPLRSYGVFYCTKSHFTVHRRSRDIIQVYVTVHVHAPDDK
jgi:hypothetical protein